MTWYPPWANGVVAPPDPPAVADPGVLPGETCVQYVTRMHPERDAAHWRLTLCYCHVPPDAPAGEWVEGLRRVLGSEPHLIHKEGP